MEKFFGMTDVRCTCGKVMTQNDLDMIERLVTNGISARDAMTQAGYKRICCRRTAMETTNYITTGGANIGTVVPKPLIEKDRLKGLPIIPEEFTSMAGVLQREVGTVEEPVYGQVEIEGTTESPQIGVLDLVNLQGDQVVPQEPELKPDLPKELAGMVEPELTEDVFTRELKPGESVPTGFRREETGKIKMVDVGLGFKVPVLTTMFTT